MLKAIDGVDNAIYRLIKEGAHNVVASGECDQKAGEWKSPAST